MSEEVKSNHRANVVRINEIRKHEGADTLGLVDIGGYQVVVRLADWKVGDLGVYVQPDSVVPELPVFAFLWADKEFPAGEVPAKYRRVKAKRLRKEWSEGLLMPVTDFSDVWEACSHLVEEGDDVAELLGITHYEPPEDPENTKGENERGPSAKHWPRSLRGWFYLILETFGIHAKGSAIHGPGLPVYDVEAFKNFHNAFEDGEPVVVTEKIHVAGVRSAPILNPRKLLVCGCLRTSCRLEK